MKELLPDIVRSLPYALAVVNSEGKVLFASEAMVALGRSLGLPVRYEPGALQVTDLLPREIIEATSLPDVIRSRFERDGAMPPRLIQYRAPGVWRVYQYSVTPLLRAGALRACLVVFEDVTAPTNLRYEYRGLRDLYEKVLASIPAGIAVFGSSGHIRMANRRFGELAGGDISARTDLTVSGLPPLARAIQERAGGLRELLHRLRSNPGPIHWTGVPWTDGAGPRRFYDITLSALAFVPHEREEEREDFLLTLTDITVDVNARELEERVRRMQTLASLGEMMAGLAHEINNPLAVISGNAQLLCSTFKDAHLDRITPADWKEIVASFTSVERESARCAKTVAGFLLLSHRRPAGPPAHESVCVNKMISDLLQVYQPILAKGRIRVRAELDPRAPQVTADPDELRQVFINLITNAQQAMPNGGALELRTAMEPPWVVAVVQDSGCGIKKEHLGRIFDPLFTTKPAGSGTGMGLSIADSIVGQYSGSIEVQSEEGRGARFTILLPLAGREAPQPQQTAVPARATA